MIKLNVYQVDAFAGEPFKGNPAAVCIVDCDLSDKQMQLIAYEMNLSETAFVSPTDKHNVYKLRWFTPRVEVDLCGHATLSAAKVLFDNANKSDAEIKFMTKSGVLTAKKHKKGIVLDFPIDSFIEDIEPGNEILQALGIKNYEKAIYGKSSKKLVIHLNDFNEVINMKPDFGKMKEINFNRDVKGVGVTAEGTGKYDIISRYFNPWAGVNEDPVTGSVHTLLISYWSSLLNKSELFAYQASERGGELLLRARNERVEIIGEAVIVLKGELYF